MKERDVILVPLPQADGQRKPRPAILLRRVPPFGDWLACGVNEVSQAAAEVSFRGLPDSCWRSMNGNMNVVTLTAHFDGKNICPDEPCELPANTRLRVTIIPESAGSDQDWWYELGRQSLARAYGEDEPDYSEHIGKMPPE